MKHLVAAGFICVGAAAAAETPVLTVYTYDSFVSDWGPGPQVEAAFEAECACDLNLVGIEDGAALLSRIRLEGTRSEADIVLGLDTNLVAAAKETGLFAPHSVRADYTLPVAWEDDMFVPYDWGYFAFVHEAGKDVPGDFKALAASDTKILIQDPRSSTPGLGLLLWVKAAYGEEAPAVWADLADNIVTVTKGWSEAYGLFLEGEADMVLSYTTSPAYHLIAEEDASKTTAAFSEGHYMQVEVAAKLAASAEGGVGLGRADWAALRFTLVQAGLSALISVMFAIPVARALARRRFWGRSGLILLLGAPFILPVIVAVLGLLAVFGRSGWISEALGLIGLEPLRIYGLHGVVLAHVFFNLPLATRLILQGWQEVPAERFRLAEQLGCRGWALARLIELPMLVRVVPGALVVIFALCLTSFAVALTLGGGPRATTLELAIYQAFTFDFDLGRAALLSALQLGLTVVTALVALRFARIDGFGAGLGRSVQRWDKAGTGLDAVWIGAAALFLLLPLLAVVLSGLPELLSLPASVWGAAGVSLAIAAVSTVMLLALAVPIAVTIATGRWHLAELAGVLGLAASPLVIGTGLFILIHPVANPADAALAVTALVNAVLALPFALRILVPATRDILAAHGRLGLSLDMGGGVFLRRVLLPRMRPQIGFAAGLAAALSLGDLGVIALFADAETATLPLQIYRLMGAYRMDAAASGALLLLMLSMGVFWLLDRGGRWHAEA